MPIVREFGQLTTATISDTLDRAQISQSAFDWLARNAWRSDPKQKLISFESASSLRVGNFVGLIETPCGTRIEVLPKYTEDLGSVVEARQLLLTMVAEALRLSPRLGGTAHIARFDLPLPEWLASQFLYSAFLLVHRGLRQSYNEVDARERFLRGSLNVPRQIRAGPAGAHLFSFSHDVFSFNRPENRLIRSCVERVLRITRNADNWRAARELSLLLADVPTSADVKADLSRWSTDRLMADYVTIKPLCEMILQSQIPFAIAGHDRGFSMLFPMERLFEEFVTISLRRAAPPGFNVRSQVSGEHLCRFREEGWFPMRPDILISRGKERWLVDAKWKLLSTDASRGFGISQSDLYQMFAYGHKYLGGAGHLYLVYPMTSAFREPLGPFSFSSDLHLHVLPFDLKARRADYGFLKDPCQALQPETVHLLAAANGI